MSLGNQVEKSNDGANQGHNQLHIRPQRKICAVPLTTMHKDHLLACNRPSVTAGNPHFIRLQDALVPTQHSRVSHAPFLTKLHTSGFGG